MLNCDLEGLACSAYSVINVTQLHCDLVFILSLVELPWIVCPPELYAHGVLQMDKEQWRTYFVRPSANI